MQPRGAFKSLDSVNQRSSGWVKDVMTIEKQQDGLIITISKLFAELWLDRPVVGFVR